MVIDTEWLKVHNFVFCNWLVMSSKEKMIRRIFWRRGLAMSKKSGIKKIYIYEAYLYGTVEEFVMSTVIYFNRSQHAICVSGDL